LINVSELVKRWSMIGKERERKRKKGLEKVKRMGMQTKNKKMKPNKKNPGLYYGKPLGGGGISNRSEEACGFGQPVPLNTEKKMGGG